MENTSFIVEVPFEALYQDDTKKRLPHLLFLLNNMNNNSIKWRYETQFCCKKCGKTLEIVYSFPPNREPDGILFHKKCWMKTNQKPISKEEFDKLLIDCINTPPIRLKDLKEKLKKEREERKQSSK